MSIWDDPALRPAGDFVSFERIGDRVSGTVGAIRTTSFTNLVNGVPTTSVVPQIMLTTDDGEERTVTAGQTKLKVALTEQRPEAGDHISIELVRLEPRGGGKEMKHFDVKVTRGPGAMKTEMKHFDVNVRHNDALAKQVAPVATPTGGPGVDAQAAAAALAALTPAQRQALGLGAATDDTVPPF